MDISCQVKDNSAIDPEKLSYKKGSRRYPCISLGRGNRKDFAGGLWLGGDGSRRNQAEGEGGREYWKR